MGLRAAKADVSPPRRRPPCMYNSTGSYSPQENSISDNRTRVYVLQQLQRCNSLPVDGYPRPWSAYYIELPVEPVELAVGSSLTRPSIVSSLRNLLAALGRLRRSPAVAGARSLARSLVRADVLALHISSIFYSETSSLLEIVEHIVHSCSKRRSTS